MKKIISILLMLCMAFTMLAGTMVVSADEATTSADPKVVTLHSFNGLTVDSAFAHGTTSDEGALAKEEIYLRGTSNGGAVTVRSRGEGDNYIESVHNNFGYNYRRKPAEFKEWGYGENYPVLCASYDMMIPADDEYKNNRRYSIIQLGTTGSSYGSNVLTSEITTVNGKMYCETSGGSKFSNHIDYTYGEWVTVKTYAYVDTADNTKLHVLTMVDDKMMSWNTVSAGKAITGMAINSYDFKYYNDKNNKTVLTGDAAKGEDAILSVTNFDNIKVELLPMSMLPITDVAQANYVDLVRLNVTSALVDGESSTQGTNWVDDENGVRTIYAGKRAQFLYSAGIVKAAFMQSTGTKADTQYSVVKDGYRNALKVESTDKVINVENARSSIKTYTNTPGTNTFVTKADVYIPEGTEAVSRDFEVSFGLEMVNTSAAPSDFSFNSKMKNGSITINSGSSTGNATAVAGTSKKESRTISSNQWHTVQYVMEVTPMEDKYYIKCYGIFDDVLITYIERELPYRDTNEDGVSNDLGINQISMSMIPDASVTGNTHTSYFDNIYFIKNNAYDWSKINTNDWATPAQTTLVKDEDGNVVVCAKSSSAEKFTTGTLVIAICSANDVVEEFITSTVITDGEKTNSFDYTVPASKLAVGKIVRAFVFDSLVNAKPLSVSGKIVIE
ncbi:MAG: hypothetical protein IKV86_06830 [Clostridia bacterium]|nr:hypothetical protein [Clostridia bacterium]